MFAERTQRVWGYLAIAVVGAFVIMIAAKWLMLSKAFSLDHDTRVLIMAVSAALAMAWAMVFAILSFRSSDEFKQQGSMFAWYWGGSAGLAVAMPISVFIQLGGLPMIGLEPKLAPAVGVVAAHSFMIGFLLPALLQVAGFFVARTWWRVSKR